MPTFNYSIIIPHYNIPELLVRCLNSIPIRKDIQVIVVDDCSPDSDSYFENYPEFKRPYLEWYSTPKGGSAGRARNIGLDHAKGKWVICIDADDLFVDNMEEILEESLIREEDILFYNYLSVYSDDINKKASRNNYNYFFTQYSIDHDDTRFRFFYEAIWGKIIRKDLIDSHHIRCDETKYGNDLGFSLKIGYYANRITVINKPCFIITQRNDSLTSNLICGKKLSLDECKKRTYVATINQNFLDKRGMNIEINNFKAYKSFFLRDYPVSYILFILHYFIAYPYSCHRLFAFWASWKIKAIKKRIVPLFHFKI